MWDSNDQGGDAEQGSMVDVPQHELSEEGGEGTAEGRDQEESRRGLSMSIKTAEAAPLPRAAPVLSMVPQRAPSLLPGRCFPCIQSPRCPTSPRCAQAASRRRLSCVSAL